MCVQYDRDEEEAEAEAIKPKLMFNPHLQRLYQVIDGFNQSIVFILSLLLQSKRSSACS